MAERHTALIVGVGPSKGLGAAIARRFAREGFIVVLAGRSPDKIKAVADEIRAAGGVAETITGEASEEDDVRRFTDAAESIAPLAVAVHNAGGHRHDRFLDLAVSDFEQVWREHCRGGFLVGREAARKMLPRAQGTIIFTGAPASLRGRPGYAAFSAAKAGARMVSQSMAREFGPQGLHVAHVIIDGGIAGDKVLSRMPDPLVSAGKDDLLDIEAIAEAYWFIHTQHRSAWTQELDLRPWAESF
jgi:NAD(P)-dependent dehydrogenase (short-subunit alcohol dehydrogenase family)